MPDSFFVELVQDIPLASEYEINTISSASGYEVESSNSRFSVVHGGWEQFRHAAFVRRVSRIVARSAAIDDLRADALPEGTFYVRFLDFDGCHDASLESRIGDMLGGKGRISFKNPDFIVRAYHADDWYIAIEVFSGNMKEFQGRRAPMRPFFSPISIHPRHARFMVNATRTSPGETILDPFCGTGGILIEAGLTGRKVVGNDWSLQMSTGARLNLKYFGIRDYHVSNEDFLKMELDQEVAAIATDLPYGRNSRLSQRDIRDLYGKSFRKFHDILQPGGKCVIVISDESVLGMAEEFFSIEKVFPYRVHRSLTRYFVVLTRK